MALKDKYQRLIDFANQSNIQNLSVKEENGVLYVSGKTAPEVKDKLWEIYDVIDPDMRSGDVVMDIETIEEPEPEVTYEIKPGDNLSRIASKYPGMTWQKIYEANKDIIKNPDKIFPGQKIKIPKVL